MPIGASDMSLELSDVKRLANLARLEISETEANQVQQQLNQFFALVEQIQAVDTKGIEPLSHPIATITELAQPLREDTVTEPNRREACQAAAPAVEDGLYLVPRVVE